jgi:tetratricopeptide (TPR) repeat protein
MSSLSLYRRCVTIVTLRNVRIAKAICLLLSCLMFPASEVHAQAGKECSAAKTILRGHIQDAHGAAVAKANVVVQFDGAKATPRKALFTRSDTTGSFCFPDLPQGTYTLRATLDGYPDSAAATVRLTQNSVMTVDLLLVQAPSSGQQASAASSHSNSPSNSNDTISKTPEFFDQPQFEVAGVTQAGSGGHGADLVGRSTETLAKEVKSLATESTGNESTDLDTKRKTLTATLAREPENAEAHRLLGDVQEQLNNPLEAVREYRRAAEIDPNEADLFSWGMELLAHRALEPATEILEKGNHLYPKSERMVIALGVVRYSRGFYDRAAETIETACDLYSGSATPYLFLGEMQAVQAASLPGAAERLSRFAQQKPEDALANYYYAISLRKLVDSRKTGNAPKADSSRELETIESLLKKAVRLDPQLGVAHLQLGILYSERHDSAAAMGEYGEAIRVASDDKEALANAHYRLAQAYVRSGDKAKAEEEFRLHRDLAKQNADVSARERQELQQFVISLRSGENKSPDASAKH